MKCGLKKKKLRDSPELIYQVHMVTRNAGSFLLFSSAILSPGFHSQSDFMLPQGYWNSSHLIHFPSSRQKRDTRQTGPLRYLSWCPSQQVYNLITCIHLVARETRKYSSTWTPCHLCYIGIIIIEEGKIDVRQWSSVSTAKCLKPESAKCSTLVGVGSPVLG